MSTRPMKKKWFLCPLIASATPFGAGQTGTPSGNGFGVAHFRANGPGLCGENGEYAAGAVASYSPTEGCVVPSEAERES